MPRSVLISAVSLAVVALSFAALGGCDSDAEPETVVIGAGGAAAAAPAGDGQCGGWLEGAASMLTPGDLDRAAGADKAASLLTLYLQEEACTGVPPGPLPLDAAARETLARLLGEGGAEKATARRADAADARFLRTRLMDAAAVNGLVSPGTPPETAALTLNRYVAERLFPLASTLTGGARPAGTTYHARLRGEGDWADRGWLLADLLRQAELDSVLLTPWGTGEPSEPSAWLAVLLPNGGEGGATEVLLFDLRTGLPVPSPGDPDRPARLDEVRSDGATRAALTAFYETAGLPVPGEEAIAKLAPRLVGEPEWWALASGLVTLPPVGAGGPGGGRAPVTFDPLHDRAGEPGLVSRVAAAGFDPEAVTAWPVPGERAAEAVDAALPETLDTPLRVGLRPVGGVRLIEGQGLDFDPEGAEVVAGPGDRMWAARHAQLAGGRGGIREAAGTFEELLSADEVGSLVSSQPLPPASDQDVRGELASADRGAAAAAEAARRDQVRRYEAGGGLGDPAAGAAADRDRDQQGLEAIIRAAVKNGIAPWPQGEPLPEPVQLAHGAALPEAVLFLGEVQADRGRTQSAAQLWGNLINGPPNPRKALAASRLASVVAAAGETGTAAGLARQFAGGPDGPRLKVWIARWTAPPEDPGATEDTGDAGASGGRESPEPSAGSEAPDRAQP